MSVAGVDGRGVVTAVGMADRQSMTPEPTKTGIPSLPVQPVMLVDWIPRRGQDLCARHGNGNEGNLSGSSEDWSSCSAGREEGTKRPSDGFRIWPFLQMTSFTS